MALVGAFVLPHPPVILPKVDRGEQNRILSPITGCDKARVHLAELRLYIFVLLLRIASFMRIFLFRNSVPRW